MKVLPQNTPSIAASVEKAAASPDVTIMAIITAVGTALAAFQLFLPKFAIRIAMRRQVGRIERGYTGFYSVPQYLMVLVALLVWLVLLLAVLHHLNPSIGGDWPWMQQVLPFLDLQNLIPLLLVLAVLGGVIQLNVLSRIALFLARILSFVPLGRLSGAFGPKGRSAGWMQANCVCATWDKGQPLLIAQDEVARIGDELLLRLTSGEYTGEDFAPKPLKANTAANANIALFGCLIEEAHRVNHWEKPKSWTNFFEALAEIHDETKIFEPESLVAYASGQAFSQKLRDALAAKMVEKGEAVPEANYHGAASYVARAWSLTKAKKGAILSALPFFAGVIGTKLYWLDHLLSRYPLLKSDGMRHQLIKVMTRWDATPWAKKQGFLNPFSKEQAWLLLEEGVLQTFPEQKDITFWTPGDVGITKVACQRILQHVRNAACDALSAQANEVAERFPDSWDLFAAADYVLWSWGHTRLRTAKNANWEGYHWKMDGGRVSKVA